MLELERMLVFKGNVITIELTIEVASCGVFIRPAIVASTREEGR
jgi:hypothetical protein